MQKRQYDVFISYRRNKLKYNDQEQWKNPIFVAV
jgi:hypothetical protein